MVAERSDDFVVEGQLLTDVGGFGLQHSFRQLGDRLVGIRNGIDIKKWDPANDPDIPARFTPDDMSGKVKCKAELQASWSLPQRAWGTAKPEIFGSRSELCRRRSTKPANTRKLPMFSCALL